MVGNVVADEVWGDLCDVSSPSAGEMLGDLSDVSRPCCPLVPR